MSATTPGSGGAVPYTPHAISVSGGVGGVDAHYDDMVELARLFGAAGERVGQAALLASSHLFDPALIGAGALDPSGAADVERRLLALVAGAHGLPALAAHCGEVDLALRAAAAAYEVVDRLNTAIVAPNIADARLAIAAGRSLAAGHYKSALGDLSGMLAVAASPLAAAGMPYVRDLDPLDPDTPATVRATGADPGADATGPPRTVADLLTGLARRDGVRGPGSAGGGAVDVRQLIGSDGHRYAIVDLPGTKQLNPLNHGDIADWASDIRAVDGQATAYGDQVIQALRDAGIGPDVPIMMVGHSLGGMVAVQVASRCAQTHEFDVTHVVTAGSPIGLVARALPSRVQVLALENADDVIPALDGAVNPPRPNVTTVTVDHPHPNPLDNHYLEPSYLPGARDIDASSDPSVQAFLSSAHGFLSATSVSTTTFAISRLGGH